jgi:hypothetical protein
LVVPAGQDGSITETAPPAGGYFLYEAVAFIDERL